MYTKIAALALLVSGAVASDVYAQFYNSAGAINPSFDVSNPGCFAISDPTSVQFNQDAAGPYCLNAWSSGYCPSTPATTQQTFSNLGSGTSYSLTAPGAASYMWNLGACNA